MKQPGGEYASDGKREGAEHDEDSLHSAQDSVDPQVAGTGGGRGREGVREVEGREGGRKKEG